MKLVCVSKSLISFYVEHDEVEGYKKLIFLYDKQDKVSVALIQSLIFLWNEMKFNSRL